MDQDFKVKPLDWIAVLLGCWFLFPQLVSAQIDVVDPALTKISGQINSPVIPTIGLKFYRDFVTRDEELFEIPLDENNSFLMTFHLNESTPAFLVYNGEEVPLFLDPGDELFLNSNGLTFYSSLTFAGKGAGKSRFLRNLEKVFPERNSDYILYELAEKEATEFRRYMDRLNRKMWNFYKSMSLSEKDKFSPEFIEYIKLDIDYWWAYNLLRYRVEHPLSNGITEPADLPVEYYSFLNKILISNDKALRNEYYLFFVDQYLAFQNYLIDSGINLPLNLESVNVTAPSMLVFKDPNNPPILEQVEKGTTLKYLGKKTDFTSPIQIRDQILEDFWYQVVSTEGEEGWIHGAGMELVSLEKKDLSTAVTFPEQSKYRNVYQLLSGKTLYHILANDLYWRSNIISEEMLRNKVEEFVAINPYERFDEILLMALKERTDPENISEKDLTLNSRILENPKIGSKTGEEIPVESEVEIVGNELENDSRELIVTETSKGTTTPQKVIIPKKSNPLRTSPSLEHFVDINPRPSDRPTTATSFGGRVDLPTGATPTLTLYSDPIMMEELIYELEVTAGNTFTLSLNLAIPTIGKLAYGDEKIDIYLEPGDLMQVNFKGNDFFETLHFSGKGSAHNNYLKAKTKRFEQIEKEATKKAQTLKQDIYKKMLSDFRDQKNTFLSSYEDFQNFSSAFQNYAIADIDYWYGYQLLNYPWEFGFAQNLDGPAPMPASFYDFMSEISASNEGALPNAFYTYYLDQFFEYQSSLPENESLNDFQLGEKFLVGEPLAFYKAKKLSIACRRGKAQKVGKDIAGFIENNPFETYNDVLRLVYNEAKGLTEGMKAPDFSLVDVQGNSVNLSDLKGKVIYLDFWATWCTPCIHQINNSKGWKSQFKDKEVVFVYVSLDKNKTAWENFVNTHDIEGIHLAASNGDVYKSQIARLYKVKKLPTYFLIDKNGKIAYKPAPGQISERAEDKINALLVNN